MRATPPLLKDLNERTVLEAIRAAAPISRAEISRRVGISKPTVSLALQSLVETRLVRETEPASGRPGYGAVFFEPVAEAALVLGLDVGTRFVRGAICDLRGVIRARHDVELVRPDVDLALDAIASLQRSLVDATALDPGLLDGAVVGVPGAVTPAGRVELAGNIDGLEGTAFGDAVQSSLDIPVAVENDINLAALGERWQGIARGVDDFAFLSIGTGLGAGLVLGGELHRGRNGAAGELDFARAPLAEDLDPSAHALARLAEEAGAPDDPRELFASARGGDAVARRLVDELARRIAFHIASLAAVTDVDLVVLGGGIGLNGDLLLEPVRALLHEWLRFPPRVEVSALGDAAVLTGALSVGLRAALDNVFVNRRA